MISFDKPFILFISLFLILSACSVSIDPVTQGANQAPCDDPLGCVVIGPDEPLRLAGLFALTGGPEHLGIDEQYGLHVTIDEQPEVTGHEIELVIKDGGCSAETGGSVAAELAADDSLVAIIGHHCSSSCQAAG